MENNKNLQSNIWKFTVYSVLNKRAYATFLSIYLLTMPNTTAQTVGWVTLVGQLAGFLFEIPSGYISDRIGHRKGLIISRASMVLSTACYVFADSNMWFFIGGAFTALGWAFTSGTSSAFMHDTLHALGKDDRYAEIMGKVKSIGFAIPVIVILVLSKVAEFDFRTAFIIMLILDIIALFISTKFVDPPRQRSVKEIGITNFKNVLKEWYQAGWVRYIVIGSIIFSIGFGANIGFRDPYYVELGASISLIGIFWATSRIAVSVLLLANGWVYKNFSYKQVTIGKGLLYGIIFALVAYTGNLWFVAGLFILENTLRWGLMSATSQYKLEFIKNSSSKATLLSVSSMLDKILTGICGVIMGMLIVGYSYQFAYIVVGISILAVSIFALFYLPKKTTELK